MKRKVAIYARVSTEHEAQLSALDNQIQYYDGIIKQHPNWILYDRYIDEGITGTSTKKRKKFTVKVLLNISKLSFAFISLKLVFLSLCGFISLNLKNINIERSYLLR